MLTQSEYAQMGHLLGQACDFARQQPNGELPLRDQTGAIVATLKVHDLPTRPKDMPRALRPKQRLSKRQRDHAKREKLAAVS